MNYTVIKIDGNITRINKLRKLLPKDRVEYYGMYRHIRRKLNITTKYILSEYDTVIAFIF